MQRAGASGPEVAQSRVQTRSCPLSITTRKVSPAKQLPLQSFLRKLLVDQARNMSLSAAYASTRYAASEGLARPYLKLYGGNRRPAASCSFRESASTLQRDYL